MEKLCIATNMFPQLMKVRGCPPYLSAGDCLDDVGHDGDCDEEARDVVEDEGGRGGVRRLEGAPHPLAHSAGDHAVAALLVVLIEVGLGCNGLLIFI